MKFNHVLIATGLGLGFSPIAPGTIGALGGLFVAILLLYTISFYNVLLSLLIVLMFVMGVYSSNKLISVWGKDPSRVVIDEVVGMWIAIWMLPAGIIYMILAFGFFRFFDIYKPFYIRELEKLDGGWGIMMDDVVAGIYANLSVQLLSLLISVFLNSSKNI